MKRCILDFGFWVEDVVGLKRGSLGLLGFGDTMENILLMLESLNSRFVRQCLKMLQNVV